ncbi:MAG: hypothetical protein WC959_09530 [Kiritimatiellales bacterium]
MSSSNSQFNTAWAGIEAGWQSGQLAHAYVIQGAPHGAALRFAEKLLHLIFNQHPQVTTHTHPDIFWIEPQSKSRQIVIEDIRELIRKLAQTSSAGGWKAGVILAAGRMTDQAANALLKTLEEPPAKSLLLLLTDEPQALLPTILSRCQRISVAAEDEETARQWKDFLLDLLRELPPASLIEASMFSARLAGLIEKLRQEFEQEETPGIPDDLSAKEFRALLDARTGARVVEARIEILRTVLNWFRDLLIIVLDQDRSVLNFCDEIEALERQALLCSRADVLRRINAIAEMSRQFDRNLPAELVFNGFFSQLV